LEALVRHSKHTVHILEAAWREGKGRPACGRRFREAAADAKAIKLRTGFTIADDNGVLPRR
ncbi:MAG TPA: hypothetical protein DC001_00515, partial [Clostridiales bacterium]|nr:hypothetical protein [Clostridiales bacterium]